MWQQILTQRRWWGEEKNKGTFERNKNVPLCNIQLQMTPFSNMQKGNEKKLKHQNECHLRATRCNSQVPMGGGQNLKREKMFRYIDEDGIPFFQGWY